MPGIGSFPCEGCDYVAPNRRMLARHVAIHHSEKVFKCPVCPFVTLYPANWYRHKRDIHGLSKETTCEICGYFTNNHEDILRHKETEHRDHMEHIKYKAQVKEKKKHTVPSHSSTLGPHLTPGTTEVTLPKFEENIALSQEGQQDGTAEDSIQFSLPLNGGFMDDGPELNQSFEVAEEEHNSDKGANNLTGTSGVPLPSGLGPLKVKRSYSCPPCGLQTTNPREFLYHRRDVHHERITIHECKYCLYASRHIQKLHRHCGLVHRNQIGNLPPKTSKRVAKKQSPASSSSITSALTSPPQDSSTVTSSKLSFLPRNESKTDLFHSRNESKSDLFSSRSESKSELFSSRSEIKNELFSSRSETKNELLPSRNESKQFASRNESKSETFFTRTENKILKCSICSFQTKNKILLLQHEKTIHFKKKFFCCVQCGYVTNDKARYGKHVKYHNIPKVKCDLCDFQTAYKWNMDRHMRNHITGGDFRCDKCCFTANSKQSLTVHLINHHDGLLHVTGKGQGENDVYEYFDDELLDQDWEENNLDDPQFEDAMPDEFLQMEEEMQMEFEEKKGFSSSWNPDVTWKQGKIYQKSLKCSQCPFRAAWPSELKKHEEGHQPPLKKHPCPLCGMRFEHLAWLTKHLMRVHKENAQAYNIASVLQMVNPQRRKAAAKLKSNDSETLPDQQKLLSSLKSMPSTPLKQLGGSSSPSKSLTLAHTETSQVQSSPSAQKISSVENAVTTCDVCGYKTRWISELQKHMRVHSNEKPFPCPKCNYRCKWKGDLTRHLMKYHGEKVPQTSKTASIPPLKLKLTKVQNSTLGEWQGTPQEPSKSNVPNSESSSATDQDIPLDLTVKALEFMPTSSEVLGDDLKHISSSDVLAAELNEGEEYIDVEDSEMDDASNISSPSHTSLGSTKQDSKACFSGKLKVKKFRCPFCSFMTRTASRFHVHIVQHYNKRPFMCSVCEYRSNWEWDINKHIRMKASKDNTHADAYLVLTDETGRRNYEKYDKFLTEVEVNKESERTSPKLNENLEVISGNTTPERQPSNNVSTIEDNSQGSITSDEKNLKEQNESPLEGAPESIVVTPDISFANEEPVHQEQALISTQENVDDKKNPNELKLYRCTHCNYKNIEKKVVISHLAIHAGVKPFRCRICGMSSSWRHVIVRHVKVRHGGYMHDVENRITYAQQGYCIYLTSVDSNSKRANTSSGKSDVFCCKMCPYKCDKYFYMKFHMKHHRPREGASYKCLFCPYFVKFRKTLVRHMKLHSKDPEAILTKMTSPDLELNELDSATPSPATLDEDSLEDISKALMDKEDDLINIDNDDNMFDQDRRWHVENSLLKEMLHVKMKRHACEHCPYKTDNKTQYLYHKQFHRPNKNAPFKCKKCSYWATLQHLLTQHMKVHWQHEEMMQAEKYKIQESETDGICDWSESPKSFTKPIGAFSYRTEPETEGTILKRTAEHIPCVFVKRGDFLLRMFKCRFCPMTNKKRANVRLHERMHTKLSTTRFSCELCNYKCLNQGSLTNHMKIHKGHKLKKSNFKYPFDSFEDKDRSVSLHFEEKGNDFHFSRKKVHSYFCMKCPAVFKSFPDLKLHKTFHGALLPYPCPHCDYRARHKPHLHKHLQVHTALYAEKRASSRAPPYEQSGHLEMIETEENSSNNLSIVQMLLLEEAEVSAFIRSGSTQNSQKLHRCELCPAAFYKSTTLTYHLSLHGSNGKYPCSKCNYATNSSVNLSTHAKLHITSSVPVKPGRRIFFCPKCPASFNKQNRFECHIKLHGKKSRYTCDMCDYSVHYAANLFKHKAVHTKEGKVTNTQTLTTHTKKEQEDTNITSIYQSLAFHQQAANVKSSAEVQKASDTSDEKKIFICDRCPYNQARKDAVQSHQRRHSSRDGMNCPHCDYSSLQTSFLRDHTKWHLQPNPLFKVEAFMVYEKIEIWATEESENEHLFFKDEGSENSYETRFYPFTEENYEDYENDPCEESKALVSLYEDADTDTEAIETVLAIKDEEKNHQSQVIIKLPDTNVNTNDTFNHNIQNGESEQTNKSFFSKDESLPKNTEAALGKSTKLEIVTDVSTELKYMGESYDEVQKQNNDEVNHSTSHTVLSTVDSISNVTMNDKSACLQPSQVEISIEKPPSACAVSSSGYKPVHKTESKVSPTHEKVSNSRTCTALGQPSSIKEHSSKKKDIIEECDAVSDDTLPAECEYQEEITGVQDAPNVLVHNEYESLSTELNENGNIILDIGSEYFATQDTEYIQEEEVQSSEIEMDITSDAHIDVMDWKSESKGDRNEVIADVMMGEVCDVDNIVDSRDSETMLLHRNGTMSTSDVVGFMEEPSTVLEGCHTTSIVPEHETPLSEVEIHL